MGGRRLRAARSGRHRRGHLRRAGPRPRADLQPGGHQLHPRDAPARHRPRDGRLPVHRRGLRTSSWRWCRRSRRRRRPEPVLRRRYPKFDDVQCTGRGTAGRVAIREGYIRSAYQDADEKLGIARSLMGGNPTTFAGSDHGFAPQWYAVNANNVLNQALVDGIRSTSAACRHLSTAARSSDRPGTGEPCRRSARPTPTSPRPAGPAGRSRSTSTRPASGAPRSPTWPTYEEVRTAVRTAFADVTDPANPGKQVDPARS